MHHSWSTPNRRYWATAYKSKMPRSIARIPGTRQSGRSFVGFSRSGPRSGTPGFFGSTEQKFLNAESTLAAFSLTWALMNPTTGPTACLSAPQQGVEDEQHLGRTYFIKSIFIHGEVVFPASETQTDPLSDITFRICLVLDKQTNNLSLTPSEVMSTPLGVTTDALTFRNLENSHRFQILGDTGPRIMKQQGSMFVAANLFANGETKTPFKFTYVFKKPIKVRTSATTANITSIADYSIQLIGTASSTTCTFQYVSRMRFAEDG